MTNAQKQHLRAYLGFYTAAVDGIWGSKSKEATKDFQTAFNEEINAQRQGKSVKPQQRVQKHNRPGNNRENRQQPHQNALADLFPGENMKRKRQSRSDHHAAQHDVYDFTEKKWRDNRHDP